jgi:hypothetical protein
MHLLRTLLTLCVVLALVVPLRAGAADPYEIHVIIPMTGSGGFLGKSETTLFSAFETVREPARRDRRPSDQVRAARRHLESPGRRAADERARRGQGPGDRRGIVGGDVFGRDPGAQERPACVLSFKRGRPTGPGGSCTPRW